MAQVGRISGPLLTANLERNGIDLAFRNDLDTTQLLYFDVRTGKVGVNRNAPLTELNIDGLTRTVDLLGTTANIANFSLANNDIDISTGDIFLNANKVINVPTLRNAQLQINDNTISSYNTNSNIDLLANGTGTVETLANLNVAGNIHATGNITADGSLVVGDSDSDNLILGAEIASDVDPDQNRIFSLGSSTKRWLHTFTNLVNGDVVEAQSVSVGSLFYENRQGNIFWVAQNGDDTNSGEHPQAPFKTLKHALSAADASTAGPVTIHVMPGGYEEELPLVVPTNVTVRGEDMRNTIIRPDSAYQSEDIFHLNGESTVQNITIKDFYYDSINDKGYAFRFAPNTVISTRSPYIQNISVITQGTTTTADDPRGFASGDAGKGALVDGADVLSASQEASMLFHSVTFITPGVDALTMTNGVRVEWLNSFTYFADKGLYAVNGGTGHLSTDGSTIKYGAEVRSIGSANVYGNYGAYADGADCLMYLIQHNFAYNGVGKYVDNDPSRVIQSQEVTELNSGRIYFNSIDHLGNFRVGDNFFIDQESGEVSFQLTEADIDALNGLTVTTNGQTTYVDGTRVQTGNILFQDNDIISTSGNIEIDSVSGNINLTSSTNMKKDVDITGDLTFDGSLNYVGDQITDTVDFNVDFDQNIVPHQTLTHNLGSESRIWKNIYLSEANFDTVRMFDNVITTNDSNADLEFRASGTGRVYLEDENLNITNNLQVNGTTTLNNLTTNGLVTAGAINLASNFSTTNLNITQNLTVGESVQFEEILIDDNYITTTSTNADLELRASGTGQILIPTADFTITNNFDVQGTMYTSDMNIATTVESVDYDNSTIRTQSNVLETHISNADLEFRATGDVLVNNTNVEITQDLTVDQNIFTTNLTTDSLDAQTINITQDFALEDLVSSSDIQIFDNVITTTNSNSNLELRAAGTGSKYLENLEFTGGTIGSEATPDSTLTDIIFAPTEELIVDSTNAINLPSGSTFAMTQGDLRFNADDSVFEANNGSGVISFNGIYSDDRQTSVTAHPTNNTLLMDVDGNPIGSFDSDGVNLHGLQVDDININANSISTNVTNSDLELRPDGTGSIILDDIKVSDNSMFNSVANDTFVLSAATNGYWQFSGDGAVKIPTGADGDRPVAPVLGQTRVNTTSNEMETWVGDKWQTSAGEFDNVSEAEMNDISLIQTLIYG